MKLLKLLKWFGGGRWGTGCPDIFWDITKLHKVVIRVLDKSFQAPVLAEINYHRWVGGWVGEWVAGGGGGRLDQMKLRLTQPSLD